MAPRGNKRAVVNDETAPQKKSRVDPMFAGIVATLKGADDLNEHTRDMLIGMAVPCLSKTKEERHDVQQLGVSMIEETLEAQKKELIDALEVARKELSNLEGSKSVLLQHVDAAKAMRDLKQEAMKQASLTHKDAQSSAKAAEADLTEAKEAEQKAVVAYAALSKEKVAIDAAYEEHFKVPMEGEQGPQHIFLKPFLDTLGLEESLISALPSSCMKTKAQRGGFDDLVISELGKSLVAKMAALTQSVADDALVISERTASVVSSEQAVAAKNLTDQNAAADLEAATTALSEAETQVCNANEEMTTFEPRVQEATDNYNLHDTKRKNFVDGPLLNFETLREKGFQMPVEEEAATAGA